MKKAIFLLSLFVITFSSTHKAQTTFDEGLKKGIEPYTPYKLSGVKFGNYSDRLFSSSFPILLKIKKICDTSDFKQIIIIGHTDDIGSRRFNFRLSTKRAVYIKEFLSENNMTEDYINTIGVADQFPRGDNATKEGRALNRRIEVVFIPSNHLNTAEPLETYKTLNDLKYNYNKSLPTKPFAAEIRAFPINSGSELFFAHLKTQATARVFSISGQLLKQAEIAPSSSTIPFGDLTTGIYLVQVIENGKVLHSQKVKK